MVAGRAAANGQYPADLIRYKKLFVVAGSNMFSVMERCSQTVGGFGVRYVYRRGAIVLPHLQIQRHGCVNPT